MWTGVYWGLEGHPKVGIIGWSEFDAIEISSAEILVVIFSYGEALCKYNKICTDPKFPTIQ